MSESYLLLRDPCIRPSKKVGEQSCAEIFLRYFMLFRTSGCVWQPLLKELGIALRALILNYCAGYHFEEPFSKKESTFAASLTVARSLLRRPYCGGLTAEALLRRPYCGGLTAEALLRRPYCGGLLSCNRIC